MSNSEIQTLWRPVRVWKDGTRAPSDYVYTNCYAEAKSAAERDQISHTNLGYTIDEVECKVEAIQVKLYKRNNYVYTPNTEDGKNGEISEAGSPLSDSTPRA